MSRIGLALSGGGFRATIYHLGVLRYLRDAGLLHRVSHVTSVSGGSIMAAHLVMNWHKYTGSEQEFDEATNELLEFVRKDVRNRIVRRYPLAFCANVFGWVFRQGWSRRLTRPGLLEGYYEKYLFGDKCLYELPATPQLHMLATNINEGCLCSFTRSGVLTERRMPNGGTYFESIPSALATVSMAVTASSAFPGFFPPLQLTAKDVGADAGRFPPHVLTDGGVYDNLGVRMFRHIQDSWIGHKTPLTADDFVDLDKSAAELTNALNEEPELPLGRLAKLIHHRAALNGGAGSAINSDDLPDNLWNIVVHEHLYRDPCMAKLELDNEQVADLFQLAKRGRKLETGDHLWLNRSLVNAIYADSGKGRLLKSTNTKFDTVIVSDAGKEFYVSRQTSGGGLLGTAVRATGILMDRVWKLEIDHFGSDSDFVFAPISLTVNLADDPTALHPEIQRQVAVMRTDLDKFSDLEMSGLIRHGYGVMRKVCRSRPDLFGEESPSGRPWDPTEFSDEEPANLTKAASQITNQARELQGSARMRIFGKLFSLKDWPTFVYLPLILILLFGLPYFSYRAYKIAHRSEMIVDAITFSNPDFQLVLQLARQNPIPGEWETLIPEMVDNIAPADNSEFVVITDTRIYDMRAWIPGTKDDQQSVVHYRRLRVRRENATLDEAANNDTSTGIFRFQENIPINEFEMRCDAVALDPKFRVAKNTMPTGIPSYRVEAEFDLSKIPVGNEVHIGFESIANGVQARGDNVPRIVLPIIGNTNMASVWVLLPTRLPYDEVELLAYEGARGNRVESIEPTFSFEMADGSLFGWMIIAPRENYTYECVWNYRDE
jgi:predicted acylesterase/phospholipase RssA